MAVCECLSSGILRIAIVIELKMANERGEVWENSGKCCNFARLSAQIAVPERLRADLNY